MKSYVVTLVAEAGTVTLTVDAENAQDAIAAAVSGVTAAFQRATQWHVTERDRDDDA